MSAVNAQSLCLGWDLGLLQDTVVEVKTEPGQQSPELDNKRQEKQLPRFSDAEPQNHRHTA